MFVRPAPGMKSRRPDTMSLLPDHGEDVPDAEWCARRVRDGDCIEGEAAAEEHAGVAFIPQPDSEPVAHEGAL